MQKCVPVLDGGALVSTAWPVPDQPGQHRCGFLVLVPQYEVYCFVAMPEDISSVSAGYLIGLDWDGLGVSDEAEPGLGRFVNLRMHDFSVVSYDTSVEEFVAKVVRLPGDRYLMACQNPAEPKNLYLFDADTHEVETLFSDFADGPIVREGGDIFYLLTTDGRIMRESLSSETGDVIATSKARSWGLQPESLVVSPSGVYGAVLSREINKSGIRQTDPHCEIIALGDGRLVGTIVSDINTYEWLSDERLVLDTYPPGEKRTHLEIWRVGESSVRKERTIQGRWLFATAPGGLIYKWSQNRIREGEAIDISVYENGKERTLRCKEVGMTEALNLLGQNGGIEPDAPDPTSEAPTPTVLDKKR